MDSTPIGDYGLLGDTRTTALVSSAGAIDWLCFPRPESPPLFGRLVAGERGGSYSVCVEDGVLASRRYLDGTSLIETVHRAGSATVTSLDGMVADVRGDLLPTSTLVRTVTCRGGTARIRIRFDPRDGWTGRPMPSERCNGALVAARGPIALGLTTSPDLGVRPAEAVEVPMRDGDRVLLVLALSHREPAVLVDPATAASRLEATAAWWRAWSRDLDAGEIEPEAVVRSLVTLRLLTHAPSGAPIAAPTTSLPEVPGGSANWDYRYAWVRDASLGTGAFVGCGKRDEANAFVAWMLHASRLTRPRLHVAYDVYGRAGTTNESTIPGLDGYGGSRPVRVGNEAADQFQLDAYGWMIDAGWSLVRGGGDLPGESRRALWGHADLLSSRWREPDHGIWELRSAPRHYVVSKVMAWVGLDRACRLAASSRVRRRRVGRWSAERDLVAAEIRALGFDERRGAYTMAFDGDALDAATLLIPAVGFEPGTSPRVRGTIDAVRSELGAGDPLLFRFVPDGDPEGAFLPCTFWLVQALAAAGRREEAREVFAAACRLATPLGLFAEEMLPGTREHLGNFPQALTHAALVHAALALR